MTLQATSRVEEPAQDNEAGLTPQTGPRKIFKVSEQHIENLQDLTYLIVDDSRFNRKMIREALTLFGVRNILEAEDGVEALTILAEEHVDLVLTDYEMPMITGIDLTYMIRRSKELSNPAVPILMISSHTEKFRLEEAMTAGIAEYVVKPFAPDKLLHHVVRALRAAHPVLFGAA
ncbi:MAG: response regulator [Rhodospirillales bacterium]|nr:response regulator [Rhodospirillales bacterium]MBT4039792.1 response regulator [Rhodospirillales bacterium]MBT4627072.1 response regulator [Rhodospirillales bacterium]MBT5350797.1 response regulator [Rhodospirillales bacterium]MBT5519737.1 response regulator [Rhodospirillales bacterium]